jgi:hypothetical protein
MPAQGGPKLRTIVEQPLVTASIKRAKQEYPRIEEFFEGMKWALARNPIRGATRVLEGEVLLGYVMRTTFWKAGRVPSLMAVYNVTENEVIIEGFTIREE